MKKMMLLMLTLLIWSTASINAQVRIGSSLDPVAGAVLDLNKDNTGVTGTADDGNNNAGLAIPRVQLVATNNTTLPIATPAKGLTVYNTATAGTEPYNVTPGVYSFDGAKWVQSSLPAGTTINTTLVWNGSAWVPKAPGLASGTTMWFPAFILPWTSGAINQTQNLATIFNNNFSAQAAVVGVATDYNYFVTGFSNSISSASVSGTTLTYTCTTTAPAATSFLNILMVKK